MKITRTRQMMHLAIFTAISFVLYMFEIPVFGVLKMDFSDVPVLIGGIVFGPVFGYSIALFKNILHFFLKSGDLIGVLANFGFAAILLVPVLVARKLKTIHRIGVYTIGVPLAAVVMHYFNYFVTFPLYYGRLTPELVDMLWTTFFPINIMKAGVLYVIVLLLTSKMKHIYKDIV